MLALLLKIVLVLWLCRAVNARSAFLLVPHLAPAPRRRDGSPLVSIIVPARDEERAIEAATRSKCRQDDPAFEVLVVDDRSSDGTRAILRRLEAEFPGTLRVVDGVEPPPDWLGKPHALDEGAARREGDTARRLARLLGRGRRLRARISSRGPSRTRRGTASTS